MKVGCCPCAMAKKASGLGRVLSVARAIGYKGKRLVQTYSFGSIAIKYRRLEVEDMKVMRVQDHSVTEGAFAKNQAL